MSDEKKDDMVDAIVKLLLKAQEKAFANGFSKGEYYGTWLASDGAEPLDQERVRNPYSVPSGNGRCPVICSARAASYGYLEGSQCQAAAGHSTYRNIVGHDFPRPSKDDNTDDLT